MRKHGRLEKVSKIDSKTIEEYQKALAADPNSKVFAVLGEAYRELGILEQAENILRRGITKHPNYAAGYLVLAKVFIQRKELKEAIKLLNKAVEISSDNLLAYQLLGETYLQLKTPKEALKAYKMALFLNPTNSRAQQVVKSLEKATADEFEEDLFSMRSPSAELPTQNSGDQSKDDGFAIKSTGDIHLERSLSLIDALIVRQQSKLARQKLKELQDRYPGHLELQSRFEILESEEDLEQAEPIRPIAVREKRVINEKIQRLQRVLKALEHRLESSL